MRHVFREVVTTGSGGIALQGADVVRLGTMRRPEVLPCTRSKRQCSIYIYLVRSHLVFSGLVGRYSSIAPVERERRETLGISWNPTHSRETFSERYKIPFTEYI